ncbi:MAG: ribosomal protein S18-alanine N-acetyltransferase [Lachnospiraceae bacterium]|nr:ribosomal protein S18-alanine N-acetyltransferase [Lachnospiraceae bacterium]
MGKYITHKGRRFQRRRISRPIFERARQSAKRKSALRSPFREGKPTKDVKIVPLSEKHIADLARIQEQIFSQPWSEEAFRRLLTQEYYHYLVAEADDRAVGFAGFCDSFGEGEIDMVCVDRAYQRQGIANALLYELFALGARLGVTAYTLEVRVSNEPAIRLYEKHGFRGEGVRPGFYDKPKEDALIMWKR